MDASPAIYKTRMIKTPEEIDKLRKACDHRKRVPEDYGNGSKENELSWKQHVRESRLHGRRSETIGFTALGAGIVLQWCTIIHGMKKFSMGRWFISILAHSMMGIGEILQDLIYSIALPDQTSKGL